MENSIPEKMAKVAVRTALIYAVAGAVWIAVSDWVLSRFVSDPKTIEVISMFKGWLFVVVTAVVLYFVLRRQVREVARDALERQRAEELTEGLQRILEMVVTRATAAETLNALIGTIEKQDPAMICSILVLDADGRRLRHGAARRLPPEYVDAIDGQEMGPRAGSCGTAAFRGEQVIVVDIATDPLWSKYADLALAHGLRACWSTPFFDREHRVLGTFAVYYHTARPPDARHVRLVEQATHAAALCVTRHREESALRESEERFRTLIEQASDACYVCDADGRILDVNRRASEFLGYAREELLRMRTADVDVGIEEVQTRAMRETMEPGEKMTLTSRHRRKDGTEFPVEVNISCCLLGGQKVLLGLARDITERERAHAALRSSEASLREAQERLKSALEVGGIGTFVVDFRKRETFWDEPLAHIYGRTWDPKDGADPGAFLQIVHPDDRDRVAKDMSMAIEAEGIPQSEYRIMRPDGTNRWVATTARVEQDREGKPVRLIGATIDITARKIAEENFRQAQKLEAVGQLAGGIAHDFNNILTVIQAGVSFLEFEQGLTASSREFVGEIKSAATRAANLTRQLLTFSRRQAMQMRAVDLNDVVGNMSRMLQRVLGEHIKVDLRLASQALPVFADTGMLEQIVMNLAVNARDAMPEGGGLTICTRSAEITAKPTSVGARDRSGSFVCLEVCDVGIGIPDTVLPHIFEPFFTTKEAGRGTGLGLATVQGIVEQHGGWVEVQSSLHTGSTFRVFIPRHETPAPLGDMRAPRRPAGAGSETILLVEDETIVRALVRNLLLRSGYIVLDAANGPRAVELWNTHGREVDLLITDLVMPDGMSGFDLATRLRRDRPDLRVIFTSGYSAEIAHRQADLGEGTHFLPKPFSLDELSGAVRSLLDGKTSLAAEIVVHRH